MIAFDTNILVYAELSSSGDIRHSRAAEMLAKAALAGALMPLQVLGEFLHVCRRKAMLDPAAALQRVKTYAGVYAIPETTFDDLVNAQQLIARFNLQFFDALIITVVARAGATILLSEDMHDGLVIDGLTIVNPFEPANESVLAARLGSVL